ncbi:MAG TPA: adenosylcobinamide-phosphate synthase CbiB, partial [Candidatus Omnitrophota bacterium]|nr:adenosylcobinamide-phosphate synthase CbiB [Candidatus Omnitrophota bacterium]
MTSVTALIFGFLMDLVIGDPQWRWHPVRLTGRTIAWLEGRMNQGKNRKIKGIFFLILLAGSTGILVQGILSISAKNQWLEIIVSGGVIYFTISVKCLADEAQKVAWHLEAGDINLARSSLAMIVGRDTEALNEREIVRATVETVAENTMDGIIAPLFYAVLSGPWGAWVYRAVNTLDSMVGYKNKRYWDFGWASARCDAILNWIPAKITALFISLACGFSQYATGAWRWTWRHLLKGPEFNGDTVEAAMAGGLRVRLGGINFYAGTSVRKA